MRALAAVAALVCGQSFVADAVLAQQPADSLASVRRLAESGARTLALQRLESVQPTQFDAPSWLEWERLRLEVLAARGTDREVLERVRGYPSGVPAKPGSSALFLHAARAAMRSGEGGEARRWLALVFGHAGTDALGADAGAYRTARLAVIDAYLTEGNADAAYRSMLRFQQEFSPLRTEEAERFVAGLVALERYGDAANWLAQLDTRSAYAAILRLRAGMLTPDAAVAQARSLLTKGADPAALVLLEAAGRLQNDRLLLIEAAELRLSSQAAGGAFQQRSGAAMVAALWQLYGEAAQQAANQAQLLVGDDAAWHAHASRMSTLQPRLGRALLGHLALKGGNVKLRGDAQLQLILALKEAKLAPAALALFADASRFALHGLDPRVRYELGVLSVDGRFPAMALEYWRGLLPPSNLTLEQWQIRRLDIMLDAGSIEEALSVARDLLTSDRAVTTESRKRLLEIAVEALGRFQIQPAEALLDGLRTRVVDAERFAVLNALAGCYEAKGEPRQAAAAYLDAAASVSAAESDRDALRAREAAGRNLLKAGMREDARGVYAWLARNAKDVVVRESAVRALSSLPER